MMYTLVYSRPTLYRYVKTLEDAGYLTAIYQANYILGPKVTGLGFRMRRACVAIVCGEVTGGLTSSPLPL